MLGAALHFRLNGLTELHKLLALAEVGEWTAQRVTTELEDLQLCQFVELKRDGAVQEVTVDLNTDEVDQIPDQR